MENEKRLIDVNEAIKIVKHEADVCNSGFTRNILEFVAVKIENIPTVEVVHGRWTERHLNCVDKVMSFCSECLTFHNYQTNYCPNCGAKMDLED